MKNTCFKVTESAQQRGFTMIELMVTIAITAVLMTLALPSFDDTIKRWRTKTAAENVVSAIYLARSEAARFNGVSFQRNTAVDCTPSVGQWQCGWKIQTLETTPTILQVAEPAKDILITRNPSSNSMTFNQNGQQSGLAAYSFLVIHKSDSSIGNNSRAIMICVSSAGRVRTITGTNTCS